MNLSSIIVLVIVIVCFIAAVRNIMKSNSKGCGCKIECKGCSNCNNCKKHKNK